MANGAAYLIDGATTIALGESARVAPRHENNPITFGAWNRAELVILQHGRNLNTIQVEGEALRYSQGDAEQYLYQMLLALSETGLADLYVGESGAATKYSDCWWVSGEGEAVSGQDEGDDRSYVTFRLTFIQSAALKTCALTTGATTPTQPSEYAARTSEKIYSWGGTALGLMSAGGLKISCSRDPVIIEVPRCYGVRILDRTVGRQSRTMKIELTVTPDPATYPTRQAMEQWFYEHINNIGDVPAILTGSGNTWDQCHLLDVDGLGTGDWGHLDPDNIRFTFLLEADDTMATDHSVLTNLDFAHAGHTDFVSTNTVQTITAVKTFAAFPLGPSSAPTTDYQFANKKYVDDQLVGMEPALGNPASDGYILSSSSDGTRAWIAPPSGGGEEGGNGGEGVLYLFPQASTSDSGDITMDTDSEAWWGLDAYSTGFEAGDYVEWTPYLAQGTYTFRLVYRGCATSGIYRLRVGGNVISGTVDGLSESDAWNETYDWEDVAVSAAGYTAVRLEISDKNQGSMAYQLHFAALIVIRTDGGDQPASHAESHEDEGSDEISVDGLSGLLADGQDAGWLCGYAVSSEEPSDGYALVWNSTSSQWEPQEQGGGGASYLYELGDLAIPEPPATPSVGEVLQYCEANQWKNVALGNLGLNLSHISDAGTAAAADVEAFEAALGNPASDGYVLSSTAGGVRSWIAPGTPSAHKTSHQAGGADEISVAGLRGELADAQPPKTHASNHQSGGSDAVKLDDLAAPDDNTDLDVSTSKHGLTPKAPNDTDKFLRGDATWAAPPGGGGGAPTDATYWTSQAEGDLSAEVNLGALTSGLLKHAVAGGVSTPATAVENTDYAAATHASRHQNGGADEISVAGLSGELADAQTPKTHASSHQSGGADAVKLDDLAAPDDNTDLDVSTSKHGLCPKAPNDTAKFLRGDGTWNAPTGSGKARYGGFSNLRVKQVSNTSVDVDADSVVLDDGSNNRYEARRVDLTIAITTAGANGLDTGSEASSTWYFVFVIYNGSTVAGLLSASATSPTMPSGYTYSKRVGAVYNNSSSNFLSFWQLDRWVHFTTGQYAANGSVSNGAWANLSVSAIVPTTALVVHGRAGHVGSSLGAGAYLGVAVAADTSANYLHVASANSKTTLEGWGISTFFEIPLTTAQQISWETTGSTSNIFGVMVTAYEDGI